VGGGGGDVVTGKEGKRYTPMLVGVRNQERAAKLRGRENGKGRGVPAKKGEEGTASEHRRREERRKGQKGDLERTIR